MKYSIKFLIFAVTAICVGVAVFGARYQKQKQTVAWLQSYGIEVSHDRGDSPNWASAVDPNLLFDIKQLRIDRKECHDLGPISSLTSLERLTVTSAKFKTLKPIFELSRLKFLHLNQTGVQDLSGIEKLKSLETLNLMRTNVSDLKPLKELSKLQNLNLNETNIDDVGALENMSELVHLQIANTNVSDVKPLGSLKKLKILYMCDTPVSPGAVEKLRDSLPNCHVLW